MISFNKIASGLLLPGLALACTNSTIAKENKKATKPNVIVVLTDDQGYGQLDFGINKYKVNDLSNINVTKRYSTNAQSAIDAAQKAMPNVTSMAKNGVVFSNAYVASTTSAPSRAALLTGRYTQRFGIYNNYDAEAGVVKEEIFLSEVLQNNGYKTAMIGKWHLGELTTTILPEKTRDYHRDAIYGCVEDQHPLNKGFDYYYGFNYHGSNYYNATSLYRNHTHVKSQGYITDEFTAEALTFIEEKKNDPFFIYLAYNAPHIPLEEQAPREYQKFDTGNPEVDNYYATLNAVDSGIGKIISKLKELNIDKNTIIYFLSDNGAVVDSPLPCNGTFKGNKGLMFQGGIHVPMIAYCPAKFKHMVYTKNVSAMDILPTTIADAGIEVPKNVDGVNLMPYIKGDKKGSPHETMFWAGCQAYHWSDTNLGFWVDYEKYVKGSATITKVPSSDYKEYKSDPAASVLHKNWMMHYYPTTNSYELFNLSLDPSENKNLASENPKLVSKLMKKYRRWMKKMKPPVAWNRSKWEKLK